MTSKKQPELESSPADSIPADASFWVQQFVKHFELNFVEASRGLGPDSQLVDYQSATIRAVFQTLLDSGMQAESVAGATGQMLVERRSGARRWSAALNRRRFELIDKDIQGLLTPSEKLELAGLTECMREHLELEGALPMEGAKELHRRLLTADAPERPR